MPGSSFCALIVQVFRQVLSSGSNLLVPNEGSREFFWKGALSTTPIDIRQATEISMLAFYMVSSGYPQPAHWSFCRPECAVVGTFDPCCLGEMAESISNLPILKFLCKLGFLFDDCDN